MTTVTSNLELDTTFQRFLIEFLQGTLDFSSVPNGTSATLSSSLFPDLTITLTGFGLMTDTAGGLVGTVTGLSIDNTAGTARLTIPSLPQQFPQLEVLLAEANAGNGPAGPDNYFDFYFTLLKTAPITMTGSKFDDVIEGGTGGSDDILNGKKGADTFILGFGNDQINGGKGKDTLDAGEFAFDTKLKVNLKTGTVEANTVISTLNSIENVDGTMFGDIIKGDQKTNILGGFGGIDKLFGFGGKDELNGGGGADLLFGGRGADVLIGGRGDDGLAGGFGDDILLGRRGKDFFVGGSGDDTMTGGPGRDTFEFELGNSNGDDVITDFDANEIIKIIDGSLADVSVASVGTDTVITYNDGADTITLEDIDLDKAAINFDFL